MNQLRVTSYELQIVNIRFLILDFRFTVISFLLFLLFLTFTSCNKKSQISNPKFQIKDDAGVAVGFDSIPKRIISLAPNITEALFAIGADSQLVGVTDLCDYPPEAKNKTKTGSYLSPDYEVMTSLNSDLIIMNVENTSSPTYQALKNMGMKIYVSNAKDIDGILKMLTDFGKITGREQQAEQVVKNISAERERYLDLSRQKPGVKSFIVISVNPIMTANGNTFIDEIAELAGFENIYKDQQIEYPLISYEDITIKNPSCIILPIDTNNIQNIKKFTDELNGKLKSIDAVKNKNIILVDENIMFRPGPRVLDAVKLLEEKNE